MTTIFENDAIEVRQIKTGKSKYGWYYCCMACHQELKTGSTRIQWRLTLPIEKSRYSYKPYISYWLTMCVGCAGMTAKSIEYLIPQMAKHIGKP